MLSTVIKFILLSYVVMICDIANGHPLSGYETEKSNSGESLTVQLLTRPLEEDSNYVLTLLEDPLADVALDENPDDLELAEVNIFRPVFRYRVAVSKKVKGPPQF